MDNERDHSGLRKINGIGWTAGPLQHFALLYFHFAQVTEEFKSSRFSQARSLFLICKG